MFPVLIVVWCALEKLWTAPEILRENFPPPRGTQKGDIYSFSIVLFEIIMRSEPFNFDHITPRGQISGLLYVHFNLMGFYVQFVLK